MNLFIETARDGGETAFVGASRADRTSSRPAGESRGVFRPPAPSACEDACGTTGSLPVAGTASAPSYQAHRDEIIYDQRRSRRHRWHGVLRIVAMLVAIPAVLAVAFVVSYVLTLIAGGATPEEVIELLRNLWSRLQGAAFHLLGMV